MKTYRIYAENITDLFVDIEAESHLSAIAKAEGLDMEDFRDVLCGGVWRIVNAQEITS